MSSEKSEAVYMVGDSYLLHMKRTERGYWYAAFQKGHGGPVGEGAYLDAELSGTPGGKTAALKAALHDIGLDGQDVAEVGITMLADCIGSEIRRRSLFDQDSLPHNDIRFITSSYGDLFRLPDGGNIVVEYSDRQFTAGCDYIDPTHLYVDSTTYHICQFAEILERNGGTCRPEPEIFEDRTAWKVGWENHALAIRADKGGWRYAVLDKDDNVLDAGLLERPDLTMREAREAVMEKNGLSMRTRYRQDYDVVAEKVAAWHKERESEIEKQDDKIAAQTDKAGESELAAKSEIKKQDGEIAAQTDKSNEPELAAKPEIKEHDDEIATRTDVEGESGMESETDATEETDMSAQFDDIPTSSNGMNLKNAAMLEKLAVAETVAVAETAVSAGTSTLGSVRNRKDSNLGDNAEVRSSLVERLESMARDSVAAVRPTAPHRREAVR